MLTLVQSDQNMIDIHLSINYVGTTFLNFKSYQHDEQLQDKKVLDQNLDFNHRIQIWFDHVTQSLLRNSEGKFKCSIPLTAPQFSNASTIAVYAVRSINQSWYDFISNTIFWTENRFLQCAKPYQRKMA